MRGCAATRDVCSRRDPRGICIERSRRRTLSSMLRDMLVVGAGPAGILVWERRELIAQMKANCVAFAQAIEREQNCFCWKMQRRRGTFFTRPALAPWEPALTLDAILGPPSGDPQYLGCRCERVPVGGRPAPDVDRSGARAARRAGYAATPSALNGGL
jgi:hypothetical protein